MDNLESILKDKETFKQFLSSNSENRYNLKRGSLKRHAEDTLKKEKFVCSICDSSFKRKDSLNRHLKNRHAELIAESKGCLFHLQHEIYEYWDL